MALHVLAPGCRAAAVVGYSGYGDGAGFAVDHEVVTLVGIAVAFVCQGKVFAEASGADVVGVDVVGVQGADPYFPAGLVYLCEGYSGVLSRTASDVADIAQELAGGSVEELEECFPGRVDSDVAVRDGNLSAVDKCFGIAAV